jgi:DNA-binding response OmpR family regulator
MPAKKILFIEDDRAMLHALGERVNASGYEWFTISDPASIMPEILRIRPDLILLDVNMRTVNAFSVLEVLRTNADPSLARTLVIIGSDTGDLMEIGQALKFGVVDYFTKIHIDIEQVIAKIQKHIGVSVPESKPAAPTSIPLAAVLPTPPPSVASAAAPSSQEPLIKLLIVEDDKFLRDLAVQKLSKEAFYLFAAMDGEQGIAMAEKEIPNVILLDILLPGIDGFEVLRRIRANPALAATSVAMLSNFGQREDIEKALGLGADQFFIKANYTLDEIVDEVKKIAATPRAGK